MQVFFKEKYQRFDVEVPFSFALHGSMGVGGNALGCVYPKTIEELQTLVNALQEDKIPFLVLGNLTNVLPCDEPIEKIVVCTKKMIGERADENFFPAGISAAKLLFICQRDKKSGVEFLDGIPCTLGGALFMNAGVNGKYMSDVVESVDIYKDGKVQTLCNADCKFAYKQSVFMDGQSVILGAKLALKNATTEEIISLRQAYKDRRKHLPKGKSMGCVFKNVCDVSAGKLIEEAGLKGLRVGGAVVSSEHANFIINDNHATAKDVATLIKIIKNAVYSKHNIRLEEEIRYLH